MKKSFLLFIALLLLGGVFFSTQEAAAQQTAAAAAFQSPFTAAQESTPTPAEEAELALLAAQQNALPVFRYPVVPGAVISGYYDHQSSGGIVHHYNGLHNAPGAGYYFSCPSVSMYDWVGCADIASGESACSNSRELWYDGHNGIDYEFAPNWHTGAVCDPGRFGELTMPIYAPAAARVWFAGTDPNRWANGWHIRLQHDLNRNGDYNDDQFRSVYLHFTPGALAVWAGKIVQEGEYLGLGGTSGYSSSPHLHFEVQRSANYFQTHWPVDPYGWQGPGNDPSNYYNILLFRIPDPVEYSDFVYLPAVARAEHPCPGCGEVLRNNGFESGESNWIEDGVDIIANTGHPNLHVTPHGGSWLAWLGGRDNANDAVSQTFMISQGAKTATLRFYLYVSTEETFGTADTYTARLRDSNGNTIQHFETLNNAFSNRDNWVLREFSFPVDGRQGQTVTLEFRAITDGAYRTNFYIDDVSLIVSE